MTDSVWGKLAEPLPKEAISWRQQGKPKPRKALSIRFWSKADKLGPTHPVLGTRCWLWRGHLLPSGRAYISLGGRMDGREYAHRVAYRMAHGGVALTRHEHVCHRCDNPQCVNPEHLFLGTASDNMRDMLSKGRGRWRVKATHCQRGHEFTERSTRVDARGRRSCKLCAAAKDTERRLKRSAR